MKSSKLNLKLFAVLFAFFLFGLSFFCMPLQKNTATADNFIPITISDSNNNFSMQLSAVGRNQNVSLPLDKREVTATVGEQTLSYTYYCFKWRDIHYLKFRFSSNIAQSLLSFDSYEVKLTYVQTENLSTPFGNGNEKVLSRGSIENNQFANFDLYYYIDSDTQIYESKDRFIGNDFGLYKFDFCYTMSDEDNESIPRSIGSFYIAILPDDIDQISHENIQILYSVSSSKKLMNVYNLYLSKDYYKYVNPKYLEWVVVGTDKAKSNYIYSEKQRNSNIMYANYKTIWSTPPIAPYGNEFTFDSNDIEGEWTAYCIISDSKGNEKTRLSVEELSTIKKQEKNYMWVILIVVISVVILGGVVALVIFYLKREKIW